MLASECEEIYEFDTYGYRAKCIDPEYQPEINIIIDNENKKTMVIRETKYECKFPIERNCGPNFDLAYYKLEDYKPFEWVEKGHYLYDYEGEKQLFAPLREEEEKFNFDDQYHHNYYNVHKRLYNLNLNQ